MSINWIDPFLQNGNEQSMDDIINQLFDEMSKTVEDGSKTWILDPVALSNMKDAFVRLKGCFTGGDISMKFTPFDPEIERGAILISCKYGEIVCSDPVTFASVCRAKGCQGFDMSALTDGTTEIMVGYITGREVR